MGRSFSLRAVNLNTLPVLRELLRHQSIKTAAENLNVSPPAVSNSLRQLRAVLGDELIVRDGQTMQLTAKAKAISAQLEEALASIEDMFGREQFDPARSKHTVHVAMPDHLIGLIGGPLLQFLEREAPSMRAGFSIVSNRPVADLAGHRFDIVIAEAAIVRNEMANRIHEEKVRIRPFFKESMEFMARTGGDLEANVLPSADLLERQVICFGTQARDTASCEQSFLASLGLTERNYLIAPAYCLIPKLVEATDHIAIVPHSMVRTGLDHFGLSRLELPFAAPSYEWLILSPSAASNPPAVKWLESAIHSCAAEAGIIPAAPHESFMLGGTAAQ